MHYNAVITHEGNAQLAEFPDCPGCQTFARAGQDILARATEALAGWLELALEDGEAPQRPGGVAPWPGAHVLPVPVDARLAIALELRWARLEAGLTQAELARRVGCSQQQIAKLEQSTANPTLSTLEKLASKFGKQIEIRLPAAEAASMAVPKRARTPVVSRVGSGRRVIYSVEPRNGGRWAAQRRGTERAAVVTDTKSKALAEAKRLAKQHSLAQVIVKGENGRIQEEFTYGDAPKRSKGGTDGSR